MKHLALRARGFRPPVIASIDRDEALHLLDYVDDMVRFCSVTMPADRYYPDAYAAWAIVHRVAGNDDEADAMIAKLKSPNQSAR